MWYRRHMLKLQFHKTGKTPLKILCLGAHSDDIEIGCGGSILRLLSENRNTDVHWIVFAANGERGTEATASADHFLVGASRKRLSPKNSGTASFPISAARLSNISKRSNMNLYLIWSLLITETICTRITACCPSWRGTPLENTSYWNMKSSNTTAIWAARISLSH